MRLVPDQLIVSRLNAAPLLARLQDSQSDCKAKADRCFLVGQTTWLLAEVRTGAKGGPAASRQTMTSRNRKSLARPDSYSASLQVTSSIGAKPSPLRA
jgi:hypothetical protein